MILCSGTVHLGSSSQLDVGAHIFWIILEFIISILLMVADVFIDNKMLVVTSSISRIRRSPFFKDVHACIWKSTSAPYFKNARIVCSFLAKLESFATYYLSLA